MKELIENWKLNKTLLASKMGMSKSFFNNKLMERKPYSFNDEEIERLKNILIELRNDLEKIDQIEFNKALSIIVGKGK